MLQRVAAIIATGAVVLTLAACDSTPPTFSTPTHVAFVVGGAIGPSDATDNDDGNNYTYGVPRLLRWSATDDASCGVRYDVEEVYAGAGPYPIAEDTTAEQLAVEHNDYNGDLGGGTWVVMGWNVIARDCAGNSRVSQNLLGTNVWQESGANPQGDGRPPTITWAGSWTTQTGSWASGGQQRFTSGLNASVSFRKEFVAGQHVALVMAKGPARGSAAVYVDDVRVGTIDTHAATNDNRRIVFDRQMPGGVHTVKLVNLATAGHPRIDIDAFLT